MCTFQTPFMGTSIEETVMKIKSCKYKALPKQWSPFIKQTVSSLLSYDQEKRPSINALLRTPPIKKHIRALLSDTTYKNEFATTL